MTTNIDPKTFTLASLSLKLDDAPSLEPHIHPLQNPSSASQITHLNLSGNTLGVPAAQHLAPLLSQLTNLESANLADIFTSRLLAEIPPALDALLTALLQCKKLHTINLSDNAFGLNTQAPLVKYLERAVSLKHLVLNNNGLGPEAGTLVANALAKLAQAKRDAGKADELLQTIVCGRNRLENGSAAAWAKALAAHAECLTEVRMGQNGIRVEGVTVILREGLRDAKGLRTLDLQDNLFTLPGSKALCEVMVGWEGLGELQVSDTLMRGRGGVLLGETLQMGRNTELEVLRCQYNEVDVRGLRALVEAVDPGKKDTLPKLRRVELNGNKFSEEDPAVERLVEVLQQRKEEAGVEGESDDWGLDELDELEEESEEEEEPSDAQDEAEEVEEKAEKELQQVDEAENENVAPVKDKEVDELASRLGKTEI